MNNTKTPTAEKKIFPLRLPPDLYKKVRNEVQNEKDKGNYSYSINDFLTEIIEERFKESNRKVKRSIKCRRNWNSNRWNIT